MLSHGRNFRRSVLACLFSIWCLGIMDLVLTLWGVSLGVITEANPLMRPLLETPALAFLFKGAITTFYTGVVIYAAAINHPWTLPCLYTGLMLNGIVMFLHVGWLMPR